jgi:hypothetical protein
MTNGKMMNISVLHDFLENVLLVELMVVVQFVKNMLCFTFLSFV